MLLWTEPAVADVIQTVPASTLTDYARPIPKQENVPKETVWLLFVGGAVVLFGAVVVVENNASLFPAISRANAAMKATKKTQAPPASYNPPQPAADAARPLDREPYFTQDFERAPLDREPYFTQDFERLPKPEETAAVLAGLAEARAKVLDPAPAAAAPAPSPEAAVPEASTSVPPAAPAAAATFPSTLSSPAEPTPASVSNKRAPTVEPTQSLPAVGAAAEEAAAPAPSPAAPAAATPASTSAAATWQALETPSLQPTAIGTDSSSAAAAAGPGPSAAAPAAAAPVAVAAAATASEGSARDGVASQAAATAAAGSAAAQAGRGTENGVAAGEAGKPKVVVGMTDEQLEQMIEARRALEVYKAQARQQQQEA